MDFKQLARLAVAAVIAASAVLLAPVGASGAPRADILQVRASSLIGTVFGVVGQLTSGGSGSNSGSGSGSNSGSGSGSDSGSGSGSTGEDNSGSGKDDSSDDKSKDKDKSDDKSKDKDKDKDKSKDKAKTEIPVVIPGAAPAVAKSFNAAPVSGKVLVRLPGAKTATPLPVASSLPVGSVVDARAGVAKVTSAHDASGAVQTARFTQGVFTVKQAKSARPVTEIVLRGGHLGQCKRAAKAGAATMSRKRRGRRLWAEGKGRFRTRGRDGAATVRGTGWITTDTCSGTRVTVRHGLVAVRDFGLKKTVLVPGGKSYFAKHRGRSKR